MTGAIAFAIALAWLIKIWAHGSFALMLVPEQFLRGAVSNNLVLAALFTFLMPMLSLVAIAAGVLSVQESVGRVGLSLGLAALSVFLLTIVSVGLA